MGKYYYVRIVNDFDYEMREAIENVTVSTAMCSSGTVITYIKDVKWKKQLRAKKGLFSHYEEVYVRDKFPMICELKHTKDGKEYFLDIISGKTYWATKEYSLPPQRHIVLRGTDELPTSHVAKMLKSLSNDEITQYRNQMELLDYYSNLGYENYLKKNAKEKEDVEFISNFRKIYGK